MIVNDAFIAELIDDREKGWSDRPPDPPTNWGMSLPQWDRYCRATGRTFLAGKRHLRAATREDAFAFYRWYFDDIGIMGTDVPGGLWEHILDLYVLHSKRGVGKILADVPDVLGFSPDVPLKRLTEQVGAYAVSRAIALARIRYVTEIAERDPGKRKFHRGWVIRALKMGGLWPRPTTEV
ncbi:MAG TPA: hypothetical protein DCY18_05425 [Thauera sp.]|nr:hypothetical protein [Thauera sp.]